MAKNSLRRLSFSFVFFLGASLLAAAGCGPKPEADSYHVRGVVAAKNTGGDGLIRLSILHEEIPDFKNSEGKTVGMEPMVMTFAVASGVSAGSVEPQDKIDFEFEVHWKPAPRLLITTLQELPAGTELDLKGFTVET